MRFFTTSVVQGTFDVGRTPLFRKNCGVGWNRVAVQNVQNRAAVRVKCVCLLSKELSFRENFHVGSFGGAECL